MLPETVALLIVNRTQFNGLMYVKFGLLVRWFCESTLLVRLF